MDLLLFGDDPLEEDVERWNQQPLALKGCFLEQLVGGPCGVLTVIQSEILKFLLFEEQHASLKGLDMVTETEAANALKKALWRLLTRCNEKNDSYLYALKDSVLECKSEDEFLSFIEQNKEEVLSSADATLRFLKSCVLNRSLEQVQTDMDDPMTPLIARFGHCSQELVNLLLTGEATSNVFDGETHLGEDYKLKGIRKASLDVGYLTELEAMKYLTVGNVYKNPNLPIWVLGSSTHFTVLFSYDQQIAKISPAEKAKNEIREAFKQFQIDDGIAEVQKVQDIVDSLGIIKHFPDVLVQEGIVLLSDFELWALHALGLKEESSHQESGIDLVLVNLMDGVQVTNLSLSPGPAGEKNDSVLAATLATRWPTKKLVS
jgi:Domain of unknown function (DUF4205)